MSKDEEELPKILENMRLELGLSQVYVARCVKYSRQAIYNMEKGRVKNKTILSRLEGTLIDFYSNYIKENHLKRKKKIVTVYYYEKED